MRFRILIREVDALKELCTRVQSRFSFTYNTNYIMAAFLLCDRSRSHYSYMQIFCRFFKVVENARGYLEVRLQCYQRS